MEAVILSSFAIALHPFSLSLIMGSTLGQFLFVASPIHGQSMAILDAPSYVPKRLNWL